MAARRKAARGKKSKGKVGARKVKRATTKRAATRRRAAPGAAAKAGGSFPEVEELVQLMNEHGLSEVDYESAPDGSRRVRVSRQASAALAASAASAAAPDSAPAAVPTAPMPDVVPPLNAADGLHAFNSPMVGTFYLAPSPEAAPFVNVGDRVDETSTLCIIEAMKVMNEITPDLSGEIVSVEVENGEAVEYGQALFLIRPS